MLHLLLILAFTPLPVGTAAPAKGADLPASQIRFPGESFEDALTRYKERRKEKIDALAQEEQDSAVDLRTPLADIDPRLAPDWGSLEILHERFNTLRDRRFLSTERMPDFSRRISWLYPDDGCYARAAMARGHFEDNAIAEPAKIFAFGALEPKTDNHPNGKVWWWYHVVGLVTVEGELYVLDPAIEPRGPLTLTAWIKRMNPHTERLTFSVCNAYAYEPASPCASQPSEEKDALKDQLIYLGREWNRQKRLLRNPHMVLGEAPPWRTAAFSALNALGR